MAIQTAIKLYHTFVVLWPHSCYPKRGVIFKWEILFLFLFGYLEYLGMNSRRTNLATRLPYFCNGLFPDGIWRTTCLGLNRTPILLTSAS
jgi:hypothetical protein